MNLLHKVAALIRFLTVNVLKLFTGGTWFLVVKEKVTFSSYWFDGYFLQIFSYHHFYLFINFWWNCGILNEILSFGTVNMIDEQYLTHLRDKIAEQTWK